MSSLWTVGVAVVIAILAEIYVIVACKLNVVVCTSMRTGALTEILSRLQR